MPRVCPLVAGFSRASEIDGLALIFFSVIRITKESGCLQYPCKADGGPLL